LPWRKLKIRPTVPQNARMAKIFSGPKRIKTKKTVQLAWVNSKNTRIKMVINDMNKRVRMAS
jgi:hypothetical protein